MELMGFQRACAHDGLEVVAERRRSIAGREPYTDLALAAGGHLQDVVRRALRPGSAHGGGVGTPGDDHVVQRVLDMRRAVGRSEQALGIRLVLAEVELRR